MVDIVPIDQIVNRIYRLRRAKVTEQEKSGTGLEHILCITSKPTPRSGHGQVLVQIEAAPCKGPRKK